MTPHEPYMTDYMGIDTDGVREVLRCLNGVKLQEMHNFNTERIVEVLKGIFRRRRKAKKNKQTERYK